MRRSAVWRRVVHLVLAGLVGLLVLGGAPAAGASPGEPAVEVLSEQASLAPDGRAMSFAIMTRCDRRWTVNQAVVSVTQSEAFGQGTFTPYCNRLSNVVMVSVPVTTGVFTTGPAQASVLLSFQQGKTKEARDSAAIRVRPSVGVQLSAQGLIVGGTSVRVTVTVTCPMTSFGQGGTVRIHQDGVAGETTFPPTPCDTAPHTLSVTVNVTAGSFRPGSADALATAAIEEGGDLRTIELVDG